MLAGVQGVLTVSTLPNAREFLARALPWPQDDGTTFYVNIHHTMTPKPGSKLFPGKACTTVGQAHGSASYWVQKDSDVYVCMSGQRDYNREKTKPDGTPKFSALRRIENAVWLKSLYVDVDVKDGEHGYASPQEAVAEFTRIRKEIGLPPTSFVVMSGSGGFHVHWTFAEPIPVERWRVLSTNFVGALISKGFKGDTQCSVDCTRLLRIPGTLNHKTTPAKAVTLLGNPGPDYFVETLEKVLEPYAGIYRAPVAKAYGTLSGGPSPLFAQSTLPADIGDTGTKDLPTLDEVAAGCPFISATLADGGARNPEPLWLMSLNVAQFTTDGRDGAHDLSSGHPGYNAIDTDNKFGHVVHTRQQRNHGYPKCATIHQYGAPQCATCPLFSQGKSPIVHAVRAAPPPSLPPQVNGLVNGHAAPTVNGVNGHVNGHVSGGTPSLAALPPEYSYDPAGRICLVETDDAGVQHLRPICDYVFEKPWLQAEPPIFNFTTLTHKGRERQIRVPYEVILDKNQMPKTIARQGVLLHHDEIRPVAEFMVSWIERMKADAQHVVQNQPFGWAVNNGKVTGFVFAGHVWSGDAPRPAGVPDPVLAAQYNPSGELDAWRKAASMITSQRRPALDAIVAAAFAAPLVRFTGQTGLLMSTYSTQSGIGKSTALKVGQAVWGHPQKAIQSLNDTQNSVLKKIGDIKNLPLFWDELKTKEDTTKFVNMAFQLAQGKEKSRLASDTTYREPGTWQTLLCSTSNDSIMAHIVDGTRTTAAGLYRVFEFTVPPSQNWLMLPTEAQLLTAALNENYGYAGLEFAQFLGANHERVALEVATFSKMIEKKHDVKADERFWLALVSVIVIGAKLANEIGLTDFDLRGLSTFMMERFNGMRGERSRTHVDIDKGDNVLGYLARYLNEHKRHYSITTSSIHRGSGRPPAHVPGTPVGPQHVMLRGNSELNLRSLRIQIGEDDHWIRMAKVPFEEWLREQEVTPTTILRALEARFGVKDVRGRLCAGTHLSGVSEMMLEFNYADPAFNGMIDF